MKIKIDYTQMSKGSLTTMLKARGISIKRTDKRDDLIARLVKSEKNVTKMPAVFSTCGVGIAAIITVIILFIVL